MEETTNLSESYDRHQTMEVFPVMYHQCCVSKNRLLAMIGIVVFFSFSSALAEDSHDLVFLTWSEYMDPKLIEKFENRFNTKVKFAYFESDELRDDMLLNSDGAVYDVICLNGRSIKTYSRQDWLAPMTTKDVPNKKHIDLRWAEAFEGAAEYAVPFFWGTIGIAYREDVVKQPISSWKQLIEPAPELQGRIVLVKDARDLMVMALKSQGYSINTSNHQELDKAKSLLLAQKPYVHDYSYISLTEESALVTGDAVAALAYNGDALTVAEHDENIKYVVPEEGTAIWVDYLAVSKASKKKKLAMDFINFLNEPENAAQLAQYVYFASANKAAEKHLPQEFLSDPIIYPGMAFINSSEFYLKLPPRTQKKYNDILPQVTGE
jgi:spermidine/putrescine transport system substrate-binding protein